MRHKENPQCATPCKRLISLEAWAVSSSLLYSQSLALGLVTQQGAH